MKLDIFDKEIKSIRGCKHSSFYTIKIGLGKINLFSNGITVYFDNDENITKFADNLNEVVCKLLNGNEEEITIEL